MRVRNKNNKNSSSCHLRIFCLLFLLSAGWVHAAQNVQSLRYGVTLFHFYQQDYFEALTELMVAQQLEQLDIHTANAELLRGGMSLSYGMDRVAEEVFQDLLADQSSSVSSQNYEDSGVAWFHLAKLAWRRGV